MLTDNTYLQAIILFLVVLILLLVTAVAGMALQASKRQGRKEDAMVTMHRDSLQVFAQMRRETAQEANYREAVLTQLLVTSLQQGARVRVLPSGEGVARLSDGRNYLLDADEVQEVRAIAPRQVIEG